MRSQGWVYAGQPSRSGSTTTQRGCVKTSSGEAVLAVLTGSLQELHASEHVTKVTEQTNKVNKQSEQTK